MERRIRRRARKRRFALLAAMWTIIALVIITIGGIGIGAATGAIPIFRTPAPHEPFTPPVLPTTKPSPTHTEEPTSVPEPTDVALTTPAQQDCASTTTMSIMAHYDDDLIFTNPTIMRALAAGECVRTVFVTGGDAGQGLNYAEQREKGILAAYNVLRHVAGGWIEEHLTLDSGMPITRFTAADDDRVSVTFLRLPDGNLKGEGFNATGWESLARLRTDSIGKMHTIDTNLDVTLTELQASLVELIAAYQPSLIATLVPIDSRHSRHDHSDHSAVGSLVREAVPLAGLPLDIVRYATGYGNKSSPANVTGDELDTKLLAFWTYAQYDKVSACKTPQACLELEPFGRSLAREYFLTDSELY